MAGAQSLVGEPRSRQPRSAAKKIKNKAAAEGDFPGRARNLHHDCGRQSPTRHILARMWDDLARMCKGTAVIGACRQRGRITHRGPRTRQLSLFRSWWNEPELRLPRAARVSLQHRGLGRPVLPGPGWTGRGHLCVVGRWKWRSWESRRRGGQARPLAVTEPEGVCSCGGFRYKRNERRREGHLCDVGLFPLTPTCTIFAIYFTSDICYKPAIPCRCIRSSLSNTFF